jgi:hypothetical protein
MRNVEKIKKQNSLPSGFINKLWGAVCIGAVIWFIYAFGGSFLTLAGLFIGYKLIRLVIRLTGLVLSLVFTLISILILIAILSLLII